MIIWHIKSPQILYNMKQKASFAINENTIAFAIGHPSFHSSIYIVCQYVFVSTCNLQTWICASYAPCQGFLLLSSKYFWLVPLHYDPLIKIDCFDSSISGWVIGGHWAWDLPSRNISAGQIWLVVHYVLRVIFHTSIQLLYLLCDCLSCREHWLFIYAYTCR